jgi:undecaprenyl-diphosphatase
MIEYLEKIDHCIVLSVNGCYTPLLDQCMWFLSGKLTWIPFYVFLIYLAAKKLGINQVIFLVASALMVIVLSDLTSTYCFKNVFLRYRPSHNLLLESKLHFYEISKGNFYKGGEYGFISSHAANFFGLAIFIGLALKQYYSKLIYIMLFIAIVVSYSRLYLGVHYLSDLFVGGLVGSFYGLLVYKYIYLKFINRFKTK